MFPTQVQLPPGGLSTSCHPITARGARLRSRNAPKSSFAFGRRPAYCGQYVLGNALTAQRRARRHDDAGPSCFAQLPSGSTRTPMSLGQAEGAPPAPCVAQDRKAVRPGSYAYDQGCEITAALVRAPCADSGTDRPVALNAFEYCVREWCGRHPRSTAPRGTTSRQSTLHLECAVDPTGSGSVQRASVCRVTEAAIATTANRERGGRNVPPYR